MRTIKWGMILTGFSFLLIQFQAGAELGPKASFEGPKVTNQYKASQQIQEFPHIKSPGNFAVQDIAKSGSSYEDNVILPLVVGTEQAIVSQGPQGKGDLLPGFLDNLLTFDDQNKWLSVDDNTYFNPAQEVEAITWPSPNYPEQVVTGQLNANEPDNGNAGLVDFVVRNKEFISNGTQINGYLLVYFDFDGVKVQGSVRSLTHNACTSPKPSSEYTNGTFYYDIAIVNLNGDDYGDVIASDNCGRIVYWAGKAGQQFEAGQSIYEQQDSGYIHSFVTGNFGLTGQGPELVATVHKLLLLANGDNIEKTELVVLRYGVDGGGQAKYNINASTEIPRCFKTFEVAQGNLLGDGTPTFAVTCPSAEAVPAGRRGAANLYIFHKTTLKQIITNLSAPQGVDIGDVNNDSRADVVVALKGLNSIGIFRNNGHGCLESDDCQDHDAESAAYIEVKGPPQYVRLFDFNEDGRLDVGFTTRAANALVKNIFKNVNAIAKQANEDFANANMVYFPNALRASKNSLVSMDLAYGPNVRLNPDEQNLVFSRAVRGAVVPASEVQKLQMLSLVVPPQGDAQKFNMEVGVPQNDWPNVMVAIAGKDEIVGRNLQEVVPAATGDSFQVLINNYVSDPGLRATKIACEDIVGNTYTAKIQGSPPGTHPNHNVTIKINSVVPDAQVQMSGDNKKATIVFPDTTKDYVVNATVTDVESGLSVTQNFNYAFATNCPGEPPTPPPPTTPSPTPTTVPVSPKPTITADPEPVFNVTCPPNPTRVEGFEGDIVQVMAPLFDAQISGNVAAFSVSNVTFEQTNLFDRPIIKGVVAADTGGAIQVQFPLLEWNVPQTYFEYKMDVKMAYSLATSQGVINGDLNCPVILALTSRSVEGSGCGRCSASPIAMGPTQNLGLLILWLVGLAPWAYFRTKRS